MTKEELQKKLKDIAVFDITNIYFIKYVELIYNNLETKQQKFITNKHHIVPRCYFKINKLNIDNTKNNIVHLSYKDHLLAHYYLGQCISDQQLQIGMLRALQFMRVSTKNINTIIADETIATWYKEMLQVKATSHSQKMKGNMPIPWNKGSKNGSKYSQEQRKKMSESHTKSPQKAWLGKQLPAEMKQKISDTLKGTHLAESTKDKISKYHLANGIGKGEKNGMYATRLMTDGNSTVVVKKEYVETYLANGYKFGRLNKIKDIITGKIYWSLEDASTDLNLSKNQILKIISKSAKKLLKKYKLIKI